MNLQGVSGSLGWRTTEQKGTSAYPAKKSGRRHRDRVKVGLRPRSGNSQHSKYFLRTVGSYVLRCRGQESFLLGWKVILASGYLPRDSYQGAKNVT